MSVTLSTTVTVSAVHSAHLTALLAPGALGIDLTFMSDAAVVA